MLLEARKQTRCRSSHTQRRNTCKQISTNRAEAQHTWDTHGQLERLPSAQPGIVAGFHGRGFQEHGDWGNICASELVAGFEKYRSALQFIYVASALLSLSHTHTHALYFLVRFLSVRGAHTGEAYKDTHARPYNVRGMS